MGVTQAVSRTSKQLAAFTFAFFVILSGITSANNARAQLTPESLFSDSPTFLKVDEAFMLDFEQREDKLIVKWTIANGYYLYKKQFKTKAKGAEIGEASYQKGVEIEDEFFGISEVFFDNTEIVYPIKHANKDSVISLRFQGCAEAGLCYPPTTKVIYLDAVGESTNTSVSAESDGTRVKSQQFTLADQLLSDQSLAISLGLLLLLGIGLAFTPCVYPMYPIISSIVIGKGKEQVSLVNAFVLSFVYVQGMAITYSILGLIVASAGVQFQAMLQHPVLLGIFIILFVLLSLAMFGLYEIQLPSKWQERLNSLSNNQKRGNLVGVFFMGVISGLVASPCTTAPLTAVLLVVAQSESLVFGFSALYALSLGMGIPLILFAMTGGKLLPKAGQWMNVIKIVFGFMMLTVAILFIERIFVADWTTLLWSALSLGLFGYLYVVNQETSASFAKGIRSIVVIAGLVYATIYALQSIERNTALNTGLFSYASSEHDKAAHPEFVVVKDLKDFEQKLADANAQGKSVMVDLYADWCVACKEFEKYTFPDPQVVDALKDTVWMQIDLTDNTPTNLAFQEKFNVLGLPTILFFNVNGGEVAQARVTGFMKAAPFAEHVKLTLKN
ncbi:protein-disulfide reductase DsbD [Agaribacter marinus]|uniref:Thiol:disulfide interchange protein DsbD n=1 Tax=Agaribacter marinus TaxID=1431249 RepID=A0AA37SZH8_9ALTE|nr:protein-disulfide reductase DsbD [Agaribacter marinus]GLR71489.1 thiol:disulfide interchange protein DsbD [Agaribacter marinus]